MVGTDFQLVEAMSDSSVNCPCNRKREFEKHRLLDDSISGRPASKRLKVEYKYNADDEDPQEHNNTEEYDPEEEEEGENKNAEDGFLYDDNEEGEGSNEECHEEDQIKRLYERLENGSNLSGDDIMCSLNPSSRLMMEGSDTEVEEELSEQSDEESWWDACSLNDEDVCLEDAVQGVDVNGDMVTSGDVHADEEEEGQDNYEDCVITFDDDSEEESTFMSWRMEGRDSEEDEIDNGDMLRFMMGGMKERTLEENVNPFILSEKNMTQKDVLVCELDIPERIQLSEEITGPPPTHDESIEEESLWIYKQLASLGSPLHGMNQVLKEVNIEDVGNVLKMMHVEKFEVPFIALYRKELCSSLLKDSKFEKPYVDNETRTMRWHKVLWFIQTLDRKWLLLQKRKNELQVYYNMRFEEEARQIEDERRLALCRDLFKSAVEVLKGAQSEVEVSDIDSKFSLHFPLGDVKTEGQLGGLRQDIFHKFYCLAYKVGLWEVASRFSINSENFGLLQELEEMRRDGVEDAKETPDEVAANFTSESFPTPDDVLKCARHMAAFELSCEPIVRKHVRSVFMKKALVSTRPTFVGNSIIDVHHELSGVKCLTNRPISEFQDAQWLLIHKAEEDNLIQVTIKLTEMYQDKVVADATEFYLKECVVNSTQLWKEQRSIIMEEAIVTYVLPAMEDEARFLLTARAKTALLFEYGKQLWTKVSRAPYKMAVENAEFLPGNMENNCIDKYGARVLACCWGHAEQPTTFVMLNPVGEVTDVLYAGSLGVRSPSVAHQHFKRNDQQRLRKFLIDHQPQVVCLGAAANSRRQLKADVCEVFSEVLKCHPREFSKGLHFTMVDESFGELYENSKVSSAQLPLQPGIVRRAVGIGRYYINPVAMVATLCGPDKEILSWKLCTLDHFLSPKEKYEMAEQIIVDATNQVAVDLNLALAHPWLFASLQFVSGLGPRKASAFQRALVMDGGPVFSRKEFPLSMKMEKVFTNAAGILLVRQSGVAAAVCSHLFDLLDGTRIHPESYHLARTMAMDVCAYENEEDLDSIEMNEDALEMAIYYLRFKRDLLDALIIDEYAKSNSELYGGSKKETLEHIKEELLCSL